MTHAHAFSRALRQLPGITSNFDWFTVLCVFFVTGWSNYYGFGFMTLNWKPLYIRVLFHILLLLETRTLLYRVNLVSRVSHLPAPRSWETLGTRLIWSVSLPWPAAMQIYWNKRKCYIRKELVWDTNMATFYCFGTTIWLLWCPGKTLYRGPLNWRFTVISADTKPPDRGLMWLSTNLRSVKITILFTENQKINLNKNLKIQPG